MININIDNKVDNKIVEISLAYGAILCIILLILKMSSIINIPMWVVLFPLLWPVYFILMILIGIITTYIGFWLCDKYTIIYKKIKEKL
jgi:ABC-type antimicrobial peptide transport system permease subunit